jgi:hypothetical protein
MNPFSTSNAPQHNLISKVIGPPYQVSVDLVDIDTAYMRQVGTPLVPVENAYINQIGDVQNPSIHFFVDRVGSIDAPVMLQYLQHLGDSNNPVDTEYINNSSIQNLTAITATVQSLKVTGTFDWTGATWLPYFPGGGSGGSGTTGPAGPRGATGATGTNGTNGATGATGAAGATGAQGAQGATGPAGTGSTGGNVSGPTGQLAYFNSAGITSAPQLIFDGTTLNAPQTTIISAGQVGVLSFGTSGYDSTILSGQGYASGVTSGNYLNIGPFGGSPTMVVDTEGGLVGLNKIPVATLDVNGRGIFDYANTTTYLDVTGGTGVTGTCPLAAGLTYKIFSWGGGGAGNGGVGGAGGYTELIVTGGQTLTWSEMYGGASGGGSAIVAGLSGTTFLYVPGGGAGQTGGTGAAAGEPQGFPKPEGGESPGSTGLARAVYTDSNFWKYTVGTTFGLTGITFNTGTILSTYTPTTQVSGYSVTSDIIVFSPSVSVNETITAITGTSLSYHTFNTSGPTVVTFTTAGITFYGATFSSTQTNIPFSQGINTNLTGYGTSGATGGGTALYSTWDSITYPSFQGASLVQPPGVTLNTSAGTVYWNGTAVSQTLPTGTVFTFTYPNTSSLSEYTPVGGTFSRFTLPTGTTYTIPFDISGPGVYAPSNPVSVPVGTNINVAARQFQNTGVTASGPTGSTYGGGGYTGGGSPALVTRIPGPTGGFINVTYTSTNRPAGGGAGSWYTAPGFTGITYPGSGNIPYTNVYNRYGTYGEGTTGSSGTHGFLVVKQMLVNQVSDPALGVTGDVSIIGKLVAGGTTLGSLVSLGGITASQGIQITGALPTNGNFLVSDGSAVFLGAVQAVNYTGITGSSVVPAYFSQGLQTGGGSINGGPIAARIGNDGSANFNGIVVGGGGFSGTTGTFSLVTTNSLNVNSLSAAGLFFSVTSL